MLHAVENAHSVQVQAAQPHINVNEELAYRSLLKHVAKTSPSCRFGVLLDSRVIFGCNAKRRSSSASLNFFLSTSLPYILGGDLYPCLFQLGMGENCSDDLETAAVASSLCGDAGLTAEVPGWGRPIPRRGPGF